MKKASYILIVYLLFFFETQGQGSTGFDSFKFSIGSSFFHGDVGNGTLQLGLNSSLSYRHMFNKRWSVIPKISYTSLKADDKNGSNKERNLSFNNNIIRGDISAVYNFSDYDPAQSTFAGVIPYIGFGFGAMTNNPTTQYEAKKYELQSYNTEGENYSRFTFYIPISTGINIHINNKMYFGLEYSFQYTFSDYLDDVSKDYIDNKKLNGIASKLADRTYEGGYTPSETTDGKTWKEGSNRGSNNRFDLFSTLSFHIGYRFDSKRR